jgi:hypothetical protein
MYQTKYASAVPKNLGVGVNFRPCSEGHFLYGRPCYYVSMALPDFGDHLEQVTQK